MTFIDHTFLDQICCRRFVRDYLDLPSSLNMLPHLPLEIILDIISSTAPASLDVLLDAKHLTISLLLAFTLVWRGTQKLATKYLYRHCVYLNSERPLSFFVGYATSQLELGAVTSISLSPFCDDIDDIMLASLVRDLLYRTCHTLRKLVIDMPLRTYYPEDDHEGVRQMLRGGFERLVNLEEFVSTCDELYLDTFGDENARVWLSWPKLKRLALWNVHADESFWRSVALHQSLQMVVLSNPDSIIEVNARVEYNRHIDRPIRVFVLLLAGRSREGTDDWNDDSVAAKMGGKMRTHVTPPL